jgi:cold-inducible RNA-binding protein
MWFSESSQDKGSIRLVLYSSKWTNFLKHKPFSIMKLYVGNLSFDSTKQDLESHFSQYGSVTDVHLPEDRETGRPRGFAFVTMDSKSAMEDAIKGSDGIELAGRNLKVNEAKPRVERGGGGGGGGRY